MLDLNDTAKRLVLFGQVQANNLFYIQNDGELVATNG
jgi:hypothetical protein